MDMTGVVSLSSSEIIGLLDRRVGVGADGILHVTASSADSPSVARMTLYNSDSSRAEMSGNGVRCLAQALIDSGVAPRRPFSIDTDAGVIEIETHPPFGETVAVISVGMGLPKVGESEERLFGGILYTAVRVDIGNPHLVLFPKVNMPMETFRHLDVAALGPAIESEFLGGMNVEWVIPSDDGREMALRVWERGAGVTQACGTGSTASSYVANTMGFVGDTVLVHNPGGDLTVRITERQCYLIGPAQKICEVVITFEQLQAMAALFK